VTDSHGLRHLFGTATASSSKGGSGASGTGASAGSAGSPGPAPSAAEATASGTVTMTSEAAQDPDASSVQAFLDQYFSAINAHSYQTYVGLLSPQLQEQLTQAGFDQGYQGTADSAEQLASISADANGDTAAAVTFVSHQHPDAANNDESCTDWSITLFLQQNGDGYLIDEAPQGYHAASAPCS